MKKVTLVLGSAALMMVMAPHTASARRRAVRIALVPLAATGKGAAKVAHKATSSIAKKLKRDRRVKLIVFKQHRAKRLRACMQVPDCVQTVSKRLRVKYVMAGHVTKIRRRTFHVDLRVVRGSDGEVASSSSFKTHKSRRGARASARVALSLVHKAKRVRLATAPEPVSDAVPANAPVFSRSEAEAAANLIEARDQENPLEPEPEPEPAKEVASLQPTRSSINASINPFSLPVTVREEPSLASRIFSKRYTHAWATFGAGMAAIGGGIAFGVVSKNASAAAAQAEYQPEAWVNHDKAKKNALAANVLYGVGGAAILTSALMFYLENRQELGELRSQPDDDVSIQLQVAQKGGGLLVKGSF